MRPYALSIAGFDPSGGAGLLADSKTLEALGVYGLGVCTALTVQNDVAFERVSWVPLADIQDQIRVLLSRFAVDFVKIGLVESLPRLLELLRWLRQHYPGKNIVWDPVLKASAGYEFHQHPDAALVQALAAELTLITPNLPEMLRLWPAASAEEAAEAVAGFCPVLLKGGHGSGDESVDILFANNTQYHFSHTRLPHGEKHGSGCVLSAAILAQLALGHDLPTACQRAKCYTTAFLASNDTLLGYHSFRHLPYADQ
ncbi:hydroxymethylpyrimidine/phosphomethylpyrimidine kinase [Hymenobacter chitinivorans]|uniref:hydroxymethylpyrimidine kinase n=1 Tax=Hymenobacter chitinivorans DSM 11115 TaxID=1121954 RepID=A0A2M9B583_9BACT|nr:hydroxymethylpyrimidine/phosphomethylpyrimidine kinase [Hymenobacter chitinivorans]PJJ53109.1 hydroxymethylpyrimidine/phosphomethylpyrimidine kinase [Hymenobacter chitinivorans DSM 11115]